MNHLKPLVEEELAEPVDPRVSAFAEAVAAQYGDASRAVLFYGSCLRTTELEGQMLDFYLIVSSYEEAYGKSWLVRANELLPPNVFPAEHDGLVAKIAVLSEEDFHKLNGLKASAVSVWARFAQPSRLVWCTDEAAREKVVAAIACAPVTLFELTLPVLGIQPQAPILIWHRGFELTYGAELRAERANRPGSVVDADPERYQRFGLATMVTLQDQDPSESGELSTAEAEKRWKALRRNGKLLTLARLAKASGTYAGGIDYLAWKINRHAGTNYVIKPWQRKWPILGALTMLPRLIAGGAIK
ncbi:hypothetical protein [Sphingorhabdus sp. EL138]|uniref:hypothetical protein n=1 Tax=Sphingorhabdus sp. EL138 TaxID=2073156 RepID=UPI000D68A59F|nr:hypothetical protein [Sphingorhabdus sp. EL138]